MFGHGYSAPSPAFHAMIAERRIKLLSGWSPVMYNEAVAGVLVRRWTEDQRKTCALSIQTTSMSVRQGWLSDYVRPE